MYISKSRFINWTRCPMFFAMDLKHNPTNQIDIENEHRKEVLNELFDASVLFGESEDEEFNVNPGEEFDAMLPYFNRVEEEALKVAKKYFHGTFIANSKNTNDQKHFEFEHNCHTYHCYVDIFNENDNEINIIEVKAVTSSKFLYDGSDNKDSENKHKDFAYSDKSSNKTVKGNKYPMFVKNGNIWSLNNEYATVTDYAKKTFSEKKAKLLNRYDDKGKYPHDIAFQRFVIENSLKKTGDNRKVNYYLAVLNKDYIYDGKVDGNGCQVYDTINGQEIITFFDMNDISKEYQASILSEITTLEGYIATPHKTNEPVPVGKFCEWGKNTECLFWRHCYTRLRDVPDTNRSNNYLNSHKSFKDYGIIGKYDLINNGLYRLDDIGYEWLKADNHLIQWNSFVSGTEHINKEKMQYWFDLIEYPIYHLDFETLPCPLPRFQGENPYRQSVFEFSLHIEREPGVCDKEKDNFIFLNGECNKDERKNLAKAIIDHFEFNEDGTLKGTMLAQNTSFEIGRLKELAELFPEYRDKLLAICDKTADLIHLLKTNEDLYKNKFKKSAKIINYYHKDLSGSYSIKKTLPVLVPSLTYKGMDVGNGVQAYVAYLNYDSGTPTFGVMQTKEDRRDALKRYCQQDTWAMVEILRSVRTKI